MGLKMKIFNIMGVHWKIWFLEGVQEKPIKEGVAYCYYDCYYWLDYQFIKCTKWCSCRLHLKNLFDKVTSHSYDYKASLQFFARVSTTISDGPASRTCSTTIIWRMQIVTTTMFWHWLSSSTSVKITVS